MLSTNKIKLKASSISEKIISIRRKLHKNPELGFEEFETSSLIANFLCNLGLDVKTGVAKTGVTALLSGRKSGKTLAIRADIDALPITELNTFEYASVNKGKMHACGHDAHISIVLGAANILSSLQDELAGNIRFIFQPAEEGLGGSRLMIEDGVLASPRVDAIIAAHVDPSLKTGRISVRPGPVMATPGEFEIVISGKSGHAAEPHKSINPIITAASIVGLLKTVVKSEKDILKKAVLSVTYLHSGSSYNIIPDRAVIRGTVRTFDISLSKDISKEIESITALKAKEAGADYTFRYDIGYPPVVNDPEAVKALISSAGKIIPYENIITDAEPSMLAEDFAYYAQAVPGVYFRLGCSKTEDETVYNLHSSRFTIDEACIQTGIEIMSQFAVDFLNGKK